MFADGGDASADAIVQVRPVTDRAVYPARRGRGGDRSAAAGPLVHPMLGDLYLHQRHVADLARSSRPARRHQSHQPHLNGYE